MSQAQACVAASTASVRDPHHTTDDAARNAAWVTASETARRHVCRLASPLLLASMRGTRDVTTEADFQTFVHTAVFLAFLDAGGTPDDPAAFAWAEQHHAIVRAATVTIKRQLNGRHSLHGDIMRRTKSRRDWVGITACWSAWETGTAESADTGYAPAGADRARRHDLATCESSVTRDVRSADLSTLCERLAAALTANEYAWLLARFVERRPYQEMIDDLVAAEPARYGDAKGRARAATRIDVTIHRAKKKAAAILGGDWAAYCEELV